MRTYDLFVYSAAGMIDTIGALIRSGTWQALLGNVGQPGGGVMALRGHASIQGSTDIPTLFDLLPGYLPMPHVYGNEDLERLRRHRDGAEGVLGEHQRLHGEPAQGLLGRRGRQGQRLLLRVPAPAHRQPQHLRHRAGPD